MGKSSLERGSKTAARKKQSKSRSKSKSKSKSRSKSTAGDLAERFAQAMEELQAAHGELARLGKAVTEAHREIEEQKLSHRSAESNLRAEVQAVRTDLKTALAELEIARQEVERLRKKIAGGVTLPGLG